VSLASYCRVPSQISWFFCVHLHFFHCYPSFKLCDTFGSDLDMGSSVSFSALPVGYRAEPQPKLNLVHFRLKIWHLVATNLKIFLRIKWPNFMQYFQILCRIWKVVSSAKHWIAIASKTLAGQYGSSTVLQQVNVQSDKQCKFLGVHTALYGVLQYWQN